MLLLIVMCKVFCILVLLPILLIKWRKFYSKKREKRQQTGTVVGIFHPYCNAGGGGERVLWTAVQAIQNKYESNVFVTSNIKIFAICQI